MRIARRRGVESRVGARAVFERASCPGRCRGRVAAGALGGPGQEKARVGNGSAARYAASLDPGEGRPGMAGEMESAGAGQGGASCRAGVGSPGFASPAHSAALLFSEPGPATGTDTPSLVLTEPETWRG